MDTATLRGHDWLPNPTVLDAIPALYATENTPAADKVIHLHYFVGACDWYVAELDPATGIAFGYINLGNPHNAEWGYMSLPEMRDLTVQHPSGITVVVERDLVWTARPFGVLGMGA